MNSTVISYTNQHMDNGNFTEIFRENADAQCAKNTCEDVKIGTLVGGTFNKLKRGKVVISSSPTATAVPTSVPLAHNQQPSVQQVQHPPPQFPSPNLPPLFQQKLLIKYNSADANFLQTNNRRTISCTFGLSNPATLTPTSQPTTISPTSAAPTTSVPTTESPTRPTSQPTTISPTSAAPTTSVPTTKSPTSTQPKTCNGGLKPSPISCPPGLTCLQNSDFGKEDPNRSNIDLSLELNSTVDTKMRT